MIFWPSFSFVDNEVARLGAGGSDARGCRCHSCGRGDSSTCISAFAPGGMSTRRLFLAMQEVTVVNSTLRHAKMARREQYGTCKTAVVDGRADHAQFSSCCHRWPLGAAVVRLARDDMVTSIEVRLFSVEITMSRGPLYSLPTRF